MLYMHAHLPVLLRKRQRRKSAHFALPFDRKGVVPTLPAELDNGNGDGMKGQLSVIASEVSVPASFVEVVNGGSFRGRLSRTGT